MLAFRKLIALGTLSAFSPFSACQPYASDNCYSNDHVNVHAAAECVRDMKLSCTGNGEPSLSFHPCSGAKIDDSVAFLLYDDPNSIDCTLSVTCADGTTDSAKLSWSPSSIVHGCSAVNMTNLTVCANVADSGAD